MDRQAPAIGEMAEDPVRSLNLSRLTRWKGSDLGPSGRRPYEACIAGSVKGFERLGKLLGSGGTIRVVDFLSETPAISLATYWRATS